MKTALIVGLGIGQHVYLKVLNELKFTIDTVDTDVKKTATFKSVQNIDKRYRIAIIATPNFTHFDIADQVAKLADIVLVEKPGVLNALQWQQLITQNPTTRIMMIKNNQYRSQVKLFKKYVQESKLVEVRWKNNQRIPHPGSWFTNKDLAFGGVSRDLMPHMLSYLTALSNYTALTLTKSECLQNWQLDQITHTNYGNINYNGVYNVDDYSYLEYQDANTIWKLTADWDAGVDDIGIYFDGVKHELGLCPEVAYGGMIITALAMTLQTSDEYWAEQYKQDIFIHKQLEILNAG